MTARTSRWGAGDVVTPCETHVLLRSWISHRPAFAPRSSARQRAIPDARGREPAVILACRMRRVST